MSSTPMPDAEAVVATIEDEEEEVGEEVGEDAAAEMKTGAASLLLLIKEVAPL
jgi:hypothetical protein